MPKFNERGCTYCGAEYTPTGPAQKYCTIKCKRKEMWQWEVARRAEEGNPVGSWGGNHSGKTGVEHHAYKTGIGLFSNGLSRDYRTRVGNCERCNKDLREASPGFWAVHHKDHDRTNNNDGNFELLCKRCHQIEHECWKNLPN